MAITEERINKLREKYKEISFCLNEKAKQMQKSNCPVISVDTKKKENIGNYKNNGQELARKATPI